jgi:hypothetical protein
LYSIIPIEAFEKYYSNKNEFIVNSNYNFMQTSKLNNALFVNIYKNFYKTNIITFYSNNMNILTNTYFNAFSNFKL